MFTFLKNELSHCYYHINYLIDSVIDLVDGLYGNKPQLDITIISYCILFGAIISKLFLFLYCYHINVKYPSDIVAALAEDHLNDVFSNIGAVAGVAIATLTIAWWMDPVGAVLISIVIIYRWIFVIAEQVNKIIGYRGNPELIKTVSLCFVSFTVPFHLYNL